MTEAPTSPTNQPPQLLKYYTLRVTLPHVDLGKLQEVLNKYSRNYCAALHVADKDVPHEHFHIFFLDLDDVKIEALRKQLKVVFKRQGNGFLSGKKMDNHVYKALQYAKHDEQVTFKHRGSHWEDYIAESPDWEEKEVKKETTGKRRREADPILTYSNVLWRARAHRIEHSIQSTNLGVVLEHMTRTTNWIPSQDLMRKGLDPMHHRLFEYQASGKTGRTPDWWTPKFD